MEFDKDGKAIRVVEKPKKFISDYALTGLYVYDSRVSEIAKSLTLPTAERLKSRT